MAQDSLIVFSSVLNRLISPGQVPFDKKAIQSPLQEVAGLCVKDFKDSRCQGKMLPGLVSTEDETDKQQATRCHAQRRQAHRETPPDWRLCVVVLLRTTTGGCYGSSSFTR